MPTESLFHSTLGNTSSLALASNHEEYVVLVAILVSDETLRVNSPSAIDYELDLQRHMRVTKDTLARTDLIG